MVKLGEIYMVASALNVGKSLLQETNAWRNICILLIAKHAVML